MAPYYQWVLIDDFNKCPLYRATDDVTTELEKCPDRRTNANQIEPLLEVSPLIFYELKPRAEPMTPSSSVRKRGAVDSTTSMQSPVLKKRNIGKNSRGLAAELDEEQNHGIAK